MLTSERNKNGSIVYTSCAIHNYHDYPPPPQHYRRHYCPVHHVSGGLGVLPAHCQGDDVPTNSNYTDFYKQWKDAPRRGLKLHPSYFPPYFSTKSIPIASTHQADYKPFLGHVPPKGFKPVEVPCPFEFPQESETSYRLDYPEKDLPQLLHIADKPVINVVSGPFWTDTTHKCHFKNWRGNHKRAPVLQPISLVPYLGKFEQISTFKSDFTDKVAIEGRPSTKQKAPVKLVCDPTKRIDDATTHKETFRKDTLPKNKPILKLRTCSIKNVESGSMPYGPFVDDTHYQDIFRPQHTQRRGLIVPLDNTGIPEDQEMDLSTLYNVSYRDMSHVSPSKSYRPVEPYLPVQTKFVSTTSYHEDFRRVPANKQLQVVMNVDQAAAEIAYDHKNSNGVINKLPNIAVTTSSNKNDYKAKDIRPRVRQGDFHEIPFTPCRDVFDHKSTCHADYHQIKLKPSKSCKPLERSAIQQDPNQTNTSTYTDNYVPKDLPLIHICPAQKLLTKVL